MNICNYIAWQHITWNDVKARDIAVDWGERTQMTKGNNIAINHGTATSYYAQTWYAFHIERMFSNATSLEGHCPHMIEVGTFKQEVKIKSKSHYDRRPVSQYALVSSPIWDFWPEIFFFFCFKVTVLSLWGALSDERSGLSKNCNNIYLIRSRKPRMRP
jgi:hypothetical protein